MAELVLNRWPSEEHAEMAWKVFQERVAAGDDEEAVKDLFFDEFVIEVTNDGEVVLTTTDEDEAIDYIRSQGVECDPTIDGSGIAWTTHPHLRLKVHSRLTRPSP